MATQTMTEALIGVVNDVEIRGTLVYMSSSKEALSLVVATANPVTGKVDFPRIIIFDQNEIESVKKALKIGDRITVECCLQTSKKYPDGTLVATSVKKELSRLDAAFQGKEYLTDLNRAMLQGEIVNVYHPNENTTIVTLKWDNGEHTYYPRIVCFGNLAKKMTEKQPGDSFTALCYIQTRVRNKDDQKVYFQSVIAQNVK